MRVVSEGDAVPAFEAVDADGKILRSSDLAGKRYVVYFYPKDFTPGCTTEADEFSKHYKEFRDRGIEVVGVSPDDAASHKKFCDKMGIKFPLLADTDKGISRAFGAWGKKKFMGREYLGVTRSTFLVGKDGNILVIFRKVKPAGHARQVLDAFAR